MNANSRWLKTSGSLGLLWLALSGCQSPPQPVAASRPEIKIIDFANVPRRSLMAARTHFTSREEIAVCIRGFAGRTVHVELWEQQHGRVHVWDQAIPAPRVESRTVGANYEYYVGSVRAVPARDEVQTEVDWVIRLQQLPPGSYEVRLTSMEGLQQNASFVVSN